MSKLSTDSKIQHKIENLICLFDNPETSILHLQTIFNQQLPDLTDIAGNDTKRGFLGAALAMGNIPAFTLLLTHARRLQFDFNSDILYYTIYKYPPMPLLASYLHSHSFRPEIAALLIILGVSPEGYEPYCDIGNSISYINLEKAKELYQTLYPIQQQLAWIDQQLKTDYSELDNKKRIQLFQAILDLTQRLQQIKHYPVSIVEIDVQENNSQYQYYLEKFYDDLCDSLERHLFLVAPFLSFKQDYPEAKPLLIQAIKAILSQTNDKLEWLNGLRDSIYSLTKLHQPNPIAMADLAMLNNYIASTTQNVPTPFFTRPLQNSARNTGSGLPTPHESPKDDSPLQSALKNRHKSLHLSDPETSSDEEPRLDAGYHYQCQFKPKMA